MNKNITALISCFARCYHTKNSIVKIYNDEFAGRLLTDEEYSNIGANMAAGISFFNSRYKGDNPLEWVVNNQLAPSVLARSVFNVRHLNNEIRLGALQYVIMAAGYDTSAYSVNHIVKVFELDRPDMIEDKIRRVDNAGIERNNVSYIGCDFNGQWIKQLIDNGFDCNKKTFCSMLGISYYLTKEAFAETIAATAEHMPGGSALIFDYPDKSSTKNKEINKRLAQGAGETMRAEYTYNEIQAIADKADMLVYEHINDEEADNMFFANYNLLNRGNEINAPEGICYLMMVKQ